ncbi:unnamed protein product, partial [Hapterophycus canaliculatus]
MLNMGCEALNYVGLVRSPVVKRTPRGSKKDDRRRTKNDNEPSPGPSTERMSTRSVRSAGYYSSSPAGAGAGAASSSRRRQTLQPIDNFISGSRSTAQTPASASSLDMMSSTISSKKKALAARRCSLPVSRTLKLSPAVDTARQQQQQQQQQQQKGVAVEVRTASAGDATHHSVTHSALFSVLDRSSYTPQQRQRQQGLAATPHSSSAPAAAATAAAAAAASQGQHSVPLCVSSNNHDFTRDSLPSLQPSTSELHRHHHDNHDHDDYPSTPSFLAPGAALGDTDFLDEDRSRVWSESSFANAVFSPDPATPGSDGSNGSGRDGVEVHPAAGPPASQGGDTAHSPTGTEVGRADSSSSSSSSSRGSAAAGTACTPAAVAALMQMGDRTAAAAETPSRYRGYMVAQSPIALSAAKSSRECGEGGEGGKGEVPSTPAAAATLAAMMMAGAAPGTLGSRPAAVQEGEEEETMTTSEARERASRDAEEPPAVALRQQSWTPVPETPSRREHTSAGLPMITPRRRKAASQLLDLSKATPRGMIR